MIFNLKVAVATGILVWAVVEDLRTRKFSNRSFLIAGSVALITGLVFGGWRELIPASLGFAAGIVLFLPLVRTGIIGAGDMKLMAAFGLIAGWTAVLWTGVYGMVWGAVFGVAQIVVKGQFRTFVQNLTSIVILKGMPGKAPASAAPAAASLPLHHIPFTAPLLFGWLSYLVLSGVVL